MDPTFELLATLAGIAGIFVGFGALVASSDQDGANPRDLSTITAVSVIGLLTLVGALVPIALGGFGLSGRTLWGWSSGIFFALIWLTILHPVNRPNVMATIKTDPKGAAFFWLVLEPMIQVPLVMAIFGVFPEHGAAFYQIAVIVNLIEAAQLMLLTVLTRSQPANTGSD